MFHRAITFKNVQRSQRIGHYNRDTGSSRYFNFVDFDGSATSSDGPTIVGSDIGLYLHVEIKLRIFLDWWRYSKDCRKEWKVWICPKTEGVEIGNLNIIVPDVIEKDYPEPQHGTSVHVGKMTLWGDDISDDRSSAITRKLNLLLL